MFIYSAIMLSLVSLAAVRSISFCRICIKASQNLHDNMFHGLISTRMRFFDENPAGRIMNRFTKDLGSVDEMLPKTLLEAAQAILYGLGVIAVIIYTEIKLSIVIIAIGILFLIVRKIYLKCSKNIMRLEGMSK